MTAFPLIAALASRNTARLINRLAFGVGPCMVYDLSSIAVSINASPFVIMSTHNILLMTISRPSFTLSRSFTISDKFLLDLNAFCKVSPKAYFSVRI